MAVISTSYTQAQLTALEAAYASGARSVSHQGKTIVYTSRAEMASVLREIRLALGVTSSTSVPMVHYAKMERDDE